MCGRIVLSQNPETIQNNLHIQRWQGREQFRPSFNVAPTSNCPIIAVERTTEPQQNPGGEPVLISMKWGLSSPYMSHQPINIRSDNKGLKMQKRCIVLTEGFYEWYRKGSLRQPYYIFREGSPYVLMAGVYEQQTGANGDQQFTFAVVTTDASKPMTALHHRMPVIFSSLSSPEAQLWLNPENKWSQEYEDLLKPFEEDLTWYKVSQEVNKVSNDSKRCIEKLEDSKMNIKNFMHRKEPLPSDDQVKKEPARDEKVPVPVQQDQKPPLKSVKRSLVSTQPETEKKKSQKITHFFQAK
ncbi:DUF159-domain-containing protein [Basidiobolus meristosporus CBS 931.73]|uniref:DUF159-domain-containing protein n=1 Tax=Basidiobolus meristosporus CBS 931.73 TaxID=1314790 RepID=A0A1Y1Z198_9FUNG|nr:DUF159-domain-containing protein [Basidiobolus meristosporus CBS 931.73]|eukprot:ORY04060.1 DUF159-domain-containing protein [Basidiobolus meristosporus CBS 931.73]